MNAPLGIRFLKFESRLLIEKRNTGQTLERAMCCLIERLYLRFGLHVIQAVSGIVTEPF